MRAVVVGVMLALALSLAGHARAQDEQPAADEQAAAVDQSDSGADQAGGASESSGEPAGADAAKPASEGSRNWSFGPYFRLVVVPSFMLKLFVDLAPTPTDPAFGVTATYRTADGSPNFEMGIGYAAYAFHGPFRAKNGDPNDTEWIDSGLGLVHLTGSILWEAPIVKDTLGFQYGVGLDLGVVTGSLKRTEAYQQANGAWAKCTAPGIPSPLTCQAPQHVPLGTTPYTDPYDVKGEQYNVTQKGLPPVMAFPMLPRLGLRYSPIPDLWVRLDAAYGIAQFWFGLSAAYVPKL